MVKERKRNTKRYNIVQLTLGIAIIVLINFIASFIFTRVDLTAEKRYSLSPATKDVLKKLDDLVFFKIYLYGDLPPGFQRLSNETKEMLDEFRAYSRNIQYEFVDPSENPNAKDRNDAYRLLVERGLQPTDLRVNKKGESSQLIIFPGAVVSYHGREVPVQLLMAQLQQDPNQVLNTSIQSLEYNLARAIKSLTTAIKPRVAIIEGQGELTQLQTIDLQNSLSEYYNVDRVTINHKINSLAVRIKTDSTHDALLNKYRAIIIAKPTKPFDEKDKFLIDQFVMRGGKVLWLIDPVFASMDSLQKYNSTIGITNDINLEDMLFNYGVRLNLDLVQDMNALQIPVKTGQIGNQPQFDYFKWYFFPVLLPTIKHPIVNGLNAIKTEFISSLDTVSAPGVKKTYLLTTSAYSRTVNAPALIDLEILKHQPDERMFNKGPQPVALLLEGVFPSAFLFRIPPELSGNSSLGIRSKSKETKMIVITDGDLVKNDFSFKEGYPLPMGYDQYSRQTFGNKDLVLNAINYLCDDSGLISVRSRELKLRMLDTAKIAKQRIFWQILNLTLPVLLVLGFGLVKYRIRKFSYAGPLQKKQS
ncbi:MAG: gliding motility-associated ABC transporter substrate-binding protein GldG [Bacteroidales bacterium]|nr:gliding motility-associated ABC transporter substrate-binding protein GldG [Bacteroidales bacterium]MDD4603682.1 gliding motility-associated ABC transporter substrate-binding protein GldG [Bacteroidales bacterium]